MNADGFVFHHGAVFHALMTSIKQENSLGLRAAQPRSKVSAALIRDRWEVQLQTYFALDRIR